MTPEEARKFVPAGATVVAAIHSHPCVGEGSDEFSNNDRKLVENKIYDKAYMATRGDKGVDLMVYHKKTDGKRKYYGVSVVSQGIQCYKVTDSHKARLRDAFINRWGNHLLTDCKARFNCKNLVWPWEYKGR